MGHTLGKGPGVATVNKNPKMSPFLLKAYGRVGEAHTDTHTHGNKLNDKCLRDVSRGPRERLQKELLHGG